MLTEDIKDVLDPFIGAPSDAPGSPHEERAARRALHKTLDLLRTYDPKDALPQSGFQYLLFLEKLQRIYFELAAGRFASACNEVYSYVCEYPVQERRVRIGLILLLERIQKGEFDHAD